MTENVCKNCKAPLDLSTAKGGVVECAYCRSAFTLPKEKTDSEALAFLRMGEHESDNGDFQKAYAAYSKAAQLDSTEPEAYFGMALAEFKVQFIKDSVLDRLQPISHEVATKKFAQNKNYLRALELATPEQKAQYESLAREIDKIRDELSALEKSGLDYDCFICAKVSETKEGAEGQKTVDCERANDVYYYLRDAGYKPFFSEREIRSRTGADYEALILYALRRARCMIVVCSDEEYLNTPWVKNEYARFVELIRDEDKTRDSITIVFGSEVIERLPGKEGKIQGVSALSMDAMSRIEAFVRAHCKPTEAVKETAATGGTAQQGGQKGAFDGFVDSVKSAAAGLAREVSDGVKKAGDELLGIGRKVSGGVSSAVARASGKDPNDPLSQFEMMSTVIVGYLGHGGEVVIPASVTAMAHDVFANRTDITKVTMPKKLKRYVRAAFGKVRKNIIFEFTK